MQLPGRGLFVDSGSAIHLVIATGRIDDKTFGALFTRFFCQFIFKFAQRRRARRRDGSGGSELACFLAAKRLRGECTKTHASEQSSSQYGEAFFHNGILLETTGGAS